MPNRIKYKMYNTEKHLTRLNSAFREALEKDAGPFLEKYLMNLLKSNRQPDGKPMPKKGYTDSKGRSVGPGRKAKSTVEQYRRKGWNTENYLIRTGKSMQLKRKVTGAKTITLKIWPKDSKDSKGNSVLGHNIPLTRWKRGQIKLFWINEEAERKMMERIRKRVKQRLS